MTVADNAPVAGTGDPSTWDVVLTTPATTNTPTGTTPPPPTQINKLQVGTTGIRKDKRRSSSRFNISSNRELVRLPYVKGEFHCYIRTRSFVFILDKVV